MAWPLPDDPVTALILAVPLIWGSIIDLRRFLIPDTAVLWIALTGIITLWGSSIPIMPAALASCLVLGLGLLIAITFQKLRGYPGLGLGDVKLFAASAFWLPPADMPAALLIASLIGIAATLAQRHRKIRRVPFGPYLALAIWLTWLNGPLL